MKKAVSLLITFLMTASLCITALAADFSDLPKEHWAYGNVMTLVSEGTVNGYENGTFQPSKTVTRAEFVKMIGKWDRAYSGKLTDISSQHWAYDYIVWSGLEPVDGKIYPDKEMLRSDVINLIWKRNGSPKNNDAPYAISKQGTNQDATSWAYTIGLIQGDDGYNLRLDSALTRAEAATLILRARTVVSENKRYNFKDVVSEKLLSKVYASVNIFEGTAYSADKTLTNAEVARAATTLGAGGKSISYMDIDESEFIKHPYAKDLYILAHKVWGSEYYTVEKANQKATVQDTLSALLYGLYRRGGRTVNLGVSDAYYSDCVGANSTAMENLCLSYAAEHGIKFSAGEKLGAQRIATVKDVAVMLLLLDDQIGLELSYNSDGDKFNVSLSKNLTNYPANNADYHGIIESVPTELYNLKSNNAKPVEYYRIANECAFVYTAFLKEVETLVKSTQNTSISLTYYPSLTYQDGKRVTLIAKCVINDKSVGMIGVDKVFASMLKKNTGLTVGANQTFYVVFETYEPLMDIYLPASGAYVKNIIIPD